MKTQKIKQLAAVVGLACGMASMSTFAGTIAGSAHDFSDGELWNTTGEICVVCHAPHNNGNIIANAPLWNHQIDLGAAYNMYQGFDVDGAMGAAPGGVSLLCLSCHDGTLALDAFGGAAPAPGTKLTGNLSLGLELGDDHPISVAYSPGTAAGQDAELNPVTTGFTFADTTLGTIADLLDGASQVQCSSCHDVHNTKTSGLPGNKLLVIDNAGSALCTTCHAK